MSSEFTFFLISCTLDQCQNKNRHLLNANKPQIIARMFLGKKKCIKLIQTISFKSVGLSVAKAITKQKFSDTYDLKKNIHLKLFYALHFFFLFYVAPSFFPKASSYSLKGIAEYNNILQLFFKWITLALEKKNTVHIIAFSLNTSSSCSFKKKPHLFILLVSLLILNIMTTFLLAQVCRKRPNSASQCMLL